MVHRPFRPRRAAALPVLTARFNAGFLSLRTVSAGRLLIRASLYQAGVRVATMALRFDPPQRRAHISWLVVTPTGRGGPTEPASVAEPPPDRARLWYQPHDPPGGPQPWRLRLGRPWLPARAGHRWPVISRHAWRQVCRRGARISRRPRWQAVDRLLRSSDRLALRAVPAARHAAMAARRSASIC